jgi:hypothetical protein
MLPHYLVVFLKTSTPKHLAISYLRYRIFPDSRGPTPGLNLFCSFDFGVINKVKTNYLK